MFMKLGNDVSVLVRGWLHGNCVALAGRGGPPALIDTGYHTGTARLLAWYEQTTGRPVADIEAIGLTHIHSDHAGGVAALAEVVEAPVLAHRDAAAQAEAWDPRALWLDGTSQEMPRFSVDRALDDDELVSLGGREWRILWTPGHAVGGVSWWCEEDGLLVTGDALWEDGFGLLNPWINGPEVFALTGLALDRLDGVAGGARAVIPGHGAPFEDAAAAIARARSRLDYLRRNPDRHRRQVLFNLAAYTTLVRPEIGREALFARVRQAARSFVPSGGEQRRDDAICAEVLSALYRDEVSEKVTSDENR